MRKSISLAIIYDQTYRIFISAFIFWNFVCMSELNDTNRMTPEQLKDAGELLFGNQWQSDLARALDVDSRRVRDWLQERRPIPVGVKSEIIELLRKNSQDTASYAEILSNIELDK